MNKEEQLLVKRFRELSYQASLKGYHTFTDFLNLNEINLFFSNRKEFASVNYSFWGGHKEAERQILSFHTEDSIIIEEFNILMIEIRPVHAKFADQLTHRDFLGALIHLGIDRSKLGDILIKDNIGYVFTDYVIGDYIIQNLSKIKHTQVVCSRCSTDEVNIEPSFKEIRGTISSNRLDSVVSLALNTSRSSITGLISGGKVYVNGRIVESNSYVLKDDDIVSVRGHGKFVFKGITNQTKKGRLSATILKYI